jgi:hypothetical protein
MALALDCSNYVTAHLGLLGSRSLQPTLQPVCSGNLPAEARLGTQNSITEQSKANMGCISQIRAAKSYHEYSTVTN